MEHVKTLDEIEREKAKKVQKRLLEQQASRDRQLLDVKERHRREKKQQLLEDVAVNERLTLEKLEEQKLITAKKAQEKEYLFKMFQEN